MTHSKENLGGSEGTRVDLGDDLIEKTALLRTKLVSRPVDSILQTFKLDAVTKENMSDVLESIRILNSERLFEDGKKLLHQVLIVDPENILARKYLNDIHEEELKLLFADQASIKPKASPALMAQDLGSADPELLMRQLDRDLSLGLFSSHGTYSDSPAHLFQEELFERPEDLSAFCEQIEKRLVQADAQDWIDLGIGFLEMELYPIAIRLFSGACRHASSAVGSFQTALSATSLLALTLIRADRPYEAASRLQPMLLDVDIENKDKTELFYLMGRVYEAMKKSDAAVEFYQQVRDIDPNYRDVLLRLSEQKKGNRN